MRIFLTGATGYIGGSIGVRLVAEGHAVSGLARSAAGADALRRIGIEPVAGTLDDGDVLARAASEADAVVNAADSDHAGAVEAFVEALQGSGKPLLHTSGSSIVGDDARGEASDRVWTEEEVLAPGWRPSPDKAARVAIDRRVLGAADHGVRSVVLCNTLIYGHGRGVARDSVQIPLLVRQAESTGIARHIGPGANIWSTVHVDDVVELYVRALEGAPAGSFYFVESGEASFKAITDAIAGALGQEPAQPWDIDSAIAAWGYEPAVYALGSNSRVRDAAARADLDWRPEHASVIDWIRRELGRGA
ncbi:NAD-dependent epimerase/dehydratase family protein [Actinomadura litoris]|uniref:NAD-dependent epimerase/dehydratase family protein n=1 Tax=Actinomadura litoris TaxID=2678616 RepID=UPI001FA6B52A|nr:NAD-dependent epimerase/dehydratase family protein [Actinomadura litoris]